MKKLLSLLGISLVLFLAACGDSEDASDKTNASDETATEENTEDTKALSSALLKNHIAVANTVRNQYATVNAYIAETANEEADAEALETLKADALTAADEAIAALDSYELTEADSFTEEAKTTYEEAVSEVKGAFEAYKEAIESDATDFNAADEKIAAYTEKATTLFEEAGLSSTPDLATELQ
ncbi:hypothetical protein [Salirhabdus sp. Marseille-P4669]|uniref:hypothetical protein n=1 Tax=Salirhabdus sp. Marseille-P4669 TaxID=2042310 RepID=UPI000C7B49CC|nr:hypothetical protein [Salirhabdus sp. Marseille-P4669]